MAKGRKTGGRIAGTPNKLTLSVKEAVLESFSRLGGVNHMTEWAKENPSDFYRIAAKLIPQQLQADVQHRYEANELPDDLLAHIAAGSSAGAIEQEDGSEEPDSVH